MSAAHAEAVAAAVPPGAAPVEVIGDGPVAERLRTAVGRAGDGPLQVVVDTTGDPERIADALERLDDLGLLVLAGPLHPGQVSMDLYADLHVRGLTVVGVAPAG